MVVHDARLQDHQQEVCGLFWSQDGKMLASGGNDNCVEHGSQHAAAHDQLAQVRREGHVLEPVTDERPCHGGWDGEAVEHEQHGRAVQL